jgi:hypothetical protein
VRVLVQELDAPRVDDRLAAQRAADPPRRVLEQDQTAALGRLAVEFAGRVLAERAGAEHQ